jgi:hypothetical protein
MPASHGAKLAQQAAAEVGLLPVTGIVQAVEQRRGQPLAHRRLLGCAASRERTSPSKASFTALSKTSLYSSVASA